MVTSLTLLDGSTIPQIGFGTLGVPADRRDTAENAEQTAAEVGLALEIGYRHIDTAQMYGNERGVGLAIKRANLPREELYVTTKLGNGHHRAKDVRPAFDESMQKLGLEYLDLFLMHWPLPTRYGGDFVSTWQAMTELVADGRVRSVGVSNFQPAHLARILEETSVKPVVNQIEVNPTFANTGAVEASLAAGAAVEAWSPLGQGRALDNAAVGQIARDLGRTPSQVILRWHLQHGRIVFPKATGRQHMEENFDVFSFELSATDVAAIDALDQGPDGRGGPSPDEFDWVPDADNLNPTR